MAHHTWIGRGGASERSVYAALLQVAAAHGTLREDGVAVAVLVRELAEKARLGDKTRGKAIKRLTNAGFIRRDTAARERFENAGVIIILKERVHNLTPFIYPNFVGERAIAGGLKEWDTLHTHPAFMHGKLGKSAAALLIALLQSEGSLSRPELARQVGKDSRNIRSPLAKLVDRGIVYENEGAFTHHASWEDALEQAAQQTGAYRSLARLEERHEIDREMFQRMLVTHRSQRRKG